MTIITITSTPPIDIAIMSNRGLDVAEPLVFDCVGETATLCCVGEAGALCCVGEAVALCCVEVPLVSGVGARGASVEVGIDEREVGPELPVGWATPVVGREGDGSMKVLVLVDKNSEPGGQPVEQGSTEQQPLNGGAAHVYHLYPLGHEFSESAISLVFWAAKQKS